MKKTLTLLFSGLILLSCTKDPCLDVTCYNGGQCDDGTCMCTDWYEGTSCETEQRSKYFGTYTGSALFTYPDNTTETQTIQVAIDTHADGVQYLSGDGTFKFELTQNGTGSFNTPLQLINDPTVGNVYVQGSGSFQGSQMMWNFQMELAGSVVTVSFSGTK